MSEHPDVAHLRDGDAAFANGDFTALDDLFGEHVRWHEPWRTRTSWTRPSPDATALCGGPVSQATSDQ
ncbi:hypothetical protein ACI79D_12660 [Geodermatophilus sp. SYSU D00708]